MNSASPNRAYSAAAPLRRPLHVFVLIDALGWEYVKGAPFLDVELPYRQPLKTVLGYSSGAIPTILTGLKPSQTGHWNLLYYDPQGSPFRWLRWVSFLPRSMSDNRFARKLIKELGRRVMGMGPLFECAVKPSLLPWFNWVEKRNIYAEDGIPNSTSIFDLLKRRRIPHRVYSYHRFVDEEILRQACRDIDVGEASFFFLYLSEVDRFLHGQCSDTQAVNQQLGWYEQRLREVFHAACGRNPDASFTIISDHGMTPVRHHYDLVEKIERLGFQMPQHYLAVYDSTMARYWFFDDAARAAIMAELGRTQCGHVLEDRELEDLGILFRDRRYGEVVFLLEPGWLLASSDFNGTQWRPAGMHGYHPSDAYSDAVFLSNRSPRCQMRTIADIFTCMEEVISANS